MSTGLTEVPPDHPDRASIYAETHARPVEPLPAPARIRRITFLSLNEGRDLPALQQRMVELLGPEVRDALGRGQRQFAFTVDERRVIWELHNEFSTLSWVARADDWVAFPQGIGIELHAGFPVISATRIDLMATDSITEQAFAGLNPVSLAYCAIFDGTAEAATDFAVDVNGFTRFEVAAGRCTDLRRGVIVRRLLEIETYRNLALLGLPVARRIAPAIQHNETTLSATMQRIGTAHATGDNQSGLEQLHALAIDVGRTVEDTAFRFAATKAYGNVLKARLQRLRETAIGEYTTIQRYIDNRVEPGLATCEAIGKRLEALTEKIARSIALLNTNISLALQTQNQAVLDTISRTSQSQYRLQQTVEGLSIIAISYYALALLGYVFEGLHEVLPVEKGVALAIAAPFVLLVVWYFVGRIRSAHR